MPVAFPPRSGLTGSLHIVGVNYTSTAFNLAVTVSFTHSLSHVMFRVKNLLEQVHCCMPLV